MRPCVALRNVAKSFGRTPVLRGLDLIVERGEIVGLLGPNGSGKTTTLRLVAGFLQPDSGEIEICGQPTAADPRGARARIGYLPERPPLYDALTVTEYLDFVAAAKGLQGRARIAAVGEVIDAYELGGVARKVIGVLSKGFRQRVGLAQASLGTPDVMLLDEATNGLDPVQIVEARRFIRRGAEGRATVFSSHVLQEVAALCTRVVVVHQGRVLTVERTQTPGADTQVLDVEIEGLDLTAGCALLATIPGVASVVPLRAGSPLLLRVMSRQGTDIRAAVSARVTAEARLLALQPVRAGLEERFVEAIAASRATALEATS